MAQIPISDSVAVFGCSQERTPGVIKITPAIGITPGFEIIGPERMNIKPWQMNVGMRQFDYWRFTEKIE